MKVKFDYEDLKNFVSTAESFDSEIDAIKGRYIVDCKSIMGLLSFNFSEGFEVKINTTNNDEKERFEKAMERWRVNG